MIYQTESMVLNTVREVFSGELNSVVVCRDIRAEHPTYYTLLVIKSRECAKALLQVLEDSEKPAGEDSEFDLRCFSQNEELIYLFPYRRERPLWSFAEGQMVTPHQRESTCINLVMECLSSPLPYPLLYLLLEQGNLHIAQDNNIFFSYYFDLSQLNPGITEADCAESCARLILALLEPGMAKKRMRSLELIQKKLDKRAYRVLPELYRDIKVTALPVGKLSLWARFKRFWREHRDGLFRVLLVLCVLAAVLALIGVISQLLLGDVPLLRLFQRRFETIGTESLTGR